MSYGMTSSVMCHSTSPTYVQWRQVVAGQLHWFGQILSPIVVHQCRLSPSGLQLKLHQPFLLSTMEFYRVRLFQYTCNHTWSFSPNTFLRSECPKMTHSAPTSFTMLGLLLLWNNSHITWSHLISPVKAPLLHLWQFWAATPMLLGSFCLTWAKYAEGGATTTSKG